MNAFDFTFIAVHRHSKHGADSLVRSHKCRSARRDKAACEKQQLICVCVRVCVRRTCPIYTTPKLYYGRFFCGL